MHSIFQEEFSTSTSIGNSTLIRDEQSVRGHFQTFWFAVSKDGNFDPFEYLVVNEGDIIQFINSKITNRSVKFSLCLQVNFVKPLNDESTSSYFNSSMAPITPFLTTDEYYSHVDQVLTQINIFCTAGSGWVIRSIENLDLKLCIYRPLRASSYLETPPKLKKLSRAFLNIKNKNDNFCFVYCILAALFPVHQNQSRPSNTSPNLIESLLMPAKCPWVYAIFQILRKTV